ncbi:hypothetical protein [Burkholderia ambifaria]|uniref:hypothetical protein n=1 Tax=Burkholderia ambifaria TaxID=152480 RepID=UPI00158ED248|nr:hypothetical protein [Burkholderia ambifaria]
MRALHAACRDGRDGSRRLAALDDSARVSSEYQLATPVTAARHRAAARRGVRARPARALVSSTHADDHLTNR